MGRTFYKSRYGQFLRRGLVTGAAGIAAAGVKGGYDRASKAAYNLGKRGVQTLLDLPNNVFLDRSGKVSSRYINYSTPTRGSTKFMKKSRRSVSYGKHAGFIGKYRRMGRVYRRRYRKAFHGVQFNNEQVGTVTDDRCVYVGHHDMPVTNVAKYAIYALYKALVNKAGIDFSSFNDSVLGIFNTGDIIGVEYRLTPTSVASARTYTVPTVTSATTHATLAEGVWLLFYNEFFVNTATQMGSQTKLLKMYWNKTGVNTNNDQIDLLGCTFSFMTKSALKMQNRSLNTVEDDESTDVNNVPLVGRTYQYNGNVMVPKDNSIRDVGAGIFNPPASETGVIAFGAGGNAVLQEPPYPYYFEGNPKSAKCKMQPGDIKTSVLTWKKTMGISDFCRFVNGLFRISPTSCFNPMGKSRLFALERSIAKQGAEVSPGIQLAWEHDCKYWISANVKASKLTAQINIVQ